jgi:hypothetical protein
LIRGERQPCIGAGKRQGIRRGRDEVMIAVRRAICRQREPDRMMPVVVSD